jgi:chromosome segregation ATPase
MDDFESEVERKQGLIEAYRIKLETFEKEGTILWEELFDTRKQVDYSDVVRAELRSSEIRIETLTHRLHTTNGQLEETADMLDRLEKEFKEKERDLIRSVMEKETLLQREKDILDENDILKEVIKDKEIKIQISN